MILWSSHVVPEQSRRGAVGVGHALRGLSLAVLALAACNPSEPAAPPAVAPTPTPDEGLIVHEWGTFTSMMDSEGHLLGGMHHDDAPLPPFVVRNEQQFAVLTDGSFPEPTQRMETPVIYLHTARKLEVEVRVTFPFGLMSEWFPEAAELLPTGAATTEIAGGALRWKVEVDPELDVARVPAVDDDSIWAPSRRVAVAPLRAVETRTPAAESSLKGRLRRAKATGDVEQVEKLLFYRGVGSFELPIEVRAGAETVTVVNHARRPVAAALLLRVDGEKGAFFDIGALPGRVPLELPMPAVDRPVAEVIEAARQALLRELVASGLYQDEALALVDTWNASYFRTRGTRLLYLLPQPWTDALLPLTVTPRPVQTVRTLVGRIEILTPADEAAIDLAVGSYDATVATMTDESARFAAELELVHALAPYAESRLLWACDKRIGAARVRCDRALQWAHRGW